MTSSEAAADKLRCALIHSYSYQLLVASWTTSRQSCSFIRE